MQTIYLMTHITKEIARNYALHQQGFFDTQHMEGKVFTLETIKKIGSIQYDPLSICSPNHHLVLQSRIDGYNKSWLNDLLYKDRALVEGWDKMLSIYPMDDWHLFTTHRNNMGKLDSDKEMEAELTSLTKKIISQIKKTGPLCSLDIKNTVTKNYGWGITKLSRIALDKLFYSGKICIAKRENNRRYFNLTENIVPKYIIDKRNPFTAYNDYAQWHILRRIESIGIVQSKSPELWYGVLKDQTAPKSTMILKLLESEQLMEIEITGLSRKKFLVAKKSFLQFTNAYNEKQLETIKLIAPLDNLIWDRDTTRLIFDFDYKWEVYTPTANRKYGYYVLPLLYKNQFIGRIEPIYNRETKKIIVKNLWIETKEFSKQKINSALKEALKKFEAFQGT